MSGAQRPRGHLVERAVQAAGGSEALAGQSAARDAATPLPPIAAQPAAPARAPAAEAQPAAPALIIDTERLARAGLIVAATTRSRILEEIAVVQHQIVRTVRQTAPADGRSPRLVLVTSARPGEGKSFTSLNIGAAIAAAGGHPVVVVDLDGKPGSLSELLGCSGQPGLRRLAADPQIHPSPLLVATDRERLSFLPYGTSIPGQPSVPPGAALVAAMQRLAAALPRHIILIDAPPCLATSEASTLAPVVGQVLMVVEAERTQRGEVEAALDMVEACPQLQLVLNQSRLVGTESFGAYGYYGAYGAPSDGKTAG